MKSDILLNRNEMEDIMSSIMSDDLLFNRIHRMVKLRISKNPLKHDKSWCKRVIEATVNLAIDELQLVQLIKEKKYIIQSQKRIDESTTNLESIPHLPIPLYSISEPIQISNIPGRRFKSKSSLSSKTSKASVETKSHSIFEHSKSIVSNLPSRYSLNNQSPVVSSYEYDNLHKEEEEEEEQIFVNQQSLDVDSLGDIHQLTQASSSSDNNVLYGTHVSHDVLISTGTTDRYPQYEEEEEEEEVDPLNISMKSDDNKYDNDFEPDISEELIITPHNNNNININMNSSTSTFNFTADSLLENHKNNNNINNNNNDVTMTSDITEYITVGTTAGPGPRRRGRGVVFSSPLVASVATRDKYSRAEVLDLFYTHHDATRFSTDYDNELQRAEAVGMSWEDWMEGRTDEDVARDDQENQTQQYYEYDDDDGDANDDDDANDDGDVNDDNDVEGGEDDDFWSSRKTSNSNGKDKGNGRKMFYSSDDNDNDDYEF